MGGRADLEPEQVVLGLLAGLRGVGVWSGPPGWCVRQAVTHIQAPNKRSALARSLRFRIGDDESVRLFFAPSRHTNDALRRGVPSRRRPIHPIAHASHVIGTAPPNKCSRVTSAQPQTQTGPASHNRRVYRHATRPPPATAASKQEAAKEGRSRGHAAHARSTTRGRPQQQAGKQAGTMGKDAITVRTTATICLPCCFLHA